MAGELDGPRLEPPGGQPAKRLVVFLHGYGADGNDLIEIGRAWQGLMPHAAFVSPHAPEPCGQAPMVQGLMGNYLEQSKNLFQQMQEQMEKQTGALFTGMPGFTGGKR